MTSILVLAAVFAVVWRTCLSVPIISQSADTVVLWPNGGKDIPYEIISNSFNSNEVKQIRKVMSDITKLTDKCITFKPRTDEEDYISMDIGLTTCNTALGKRGGRQAIEFNMDPNSHCSTPGEMTHHVMHALGFDHEMTRPDRDQHIRVNWDGIRKAAQVVFKINPSQETYGVEYDLESMMHDGPFSFARDPAKPTIQAIKGDGSRMGQREGLSPLDIKKIKAAYKCL